MKQLLALIVLLLVLGLVAFFYRYEIERPMGIGSIPGVAGGSATSNQMACTDEAKVCPDGSAVGRTGPDCSFAVCPLPNVELSTGSTTIGFVLPSGYSADQKGVAHDPTLLATYEKSSNTANSPHSILVRAYSIPAGETAEQVMLANTTFESSGMTATSTGPFKTAVIQGKTFYVVILERFEGQVHSAYYLFGTNEVLRFEVLERDVSNWSDFNLNVSALPQHEALARMLATLQISGF